ncbi:unnamed protein product, partial [Rotaria sp. Silwood1]
QLESTTGNIIDALSDICRAVSGSNIIGIIGPELSREAYIIAPFRKKVGIAVISYSATDRDLSDRNTYPNFYCTISSDNIAVSVLLKLFIRFNWTSSISDTFNTSGLLVRQIITFDITTLNIRGDLKSLLTNAVTRLVVLWAESIYTSLILQKVLGVNVVGPYFT